MKRIVTYYLRPYYLRMTVGFCIKFTGTCLDLCLPWVLARMIDVVIPAGERRLIFVWGLIMLGLAAGAAICNITANRMAARVASGATQAVRADLFRKVMYLSDSQSGEVGKPSLISRLTTDTYNVYNVIGRVQRLGVRAPLLLLGGLMITMTLDAHLACILLAALAILGVVVTLVSRKSVPMYGQLQKSLDRLVLSVRENIAGIRVIKALSREDWEKERFSQVNDQVVSREKAAGLTMAVINPVMNLVLNLGLVAIVVAGAWRVNEGLTEIGKILAFLTYFTIILNALLSISKMIAILSRGVASADRIEAVLAMEEALPVEEALPAEEALPMEDALPMEEALAGEEALPEKEALAGERSGAKESGGPAHISFDHVDFSYTEGKRNLEDISFSLKRGETLGIVGATGSGKSTVLKLLLRFYDATAGSVRVCGRDVRTYPLRELRQKFGVVFQNDVIFENSILENVRMGRDLRAEDIGTALACAQAEEFVMEKSGHLEEKLNIRGANLSGGQKQRLLIARALAGKPEILILDDSSSALDYRTDAQLRAALKERFPDTTKIIVAQRVSSILHADQIMVLLDGRVQGLGTHEQLLADCEAYRRIVRSQMGA